MATNYDALYRETPHALGDMSPIFRAFFQGYTKPDARVLDIGCGQGRDALEIARAGHRVTGVDLSPVGIACMLKDADQQGLSIKGVVADICDYQPDGLFNIVLIDRTLHMLKRVDRLAVLQRLITHVAENGHLLIADETANLPDFAGILKSDSRAWEIEKRKGSLFAVLA